MMVEIGSTGAAGSTGAYGKEKSTLPDKTMDLGADTFLKLLVTQLRYQDPFSGGQDMGDFMGQIAQFTLLERVIQMQKSLEDFTAAQTPLQALTLLNKTVEVRDENGQILRGEVTAVRLQAGNPLLKVQGKEYPWQAVLQVESSPAAGEESG
jgi:flagellar basal-body rod modification protein FlgD